MVRSLRTRTRLPGLFDDFHNQLGHLMGWEEVDGKSWFAPATNLAETESAYEISLDVPGMKSEDFNVEFKDGQLWISGERTQEEEEEGKTWHRDERSYGSFRRVITLGNEVNAEEVAANYKDGVLSISVPKVPQAQTKRIEVQS